MPIQTCHIIILVGGIAPQAQGAISVTAGTCSNIRFLPGRAIVKIFMQGIQIGIGVNAHTPIVPARPGNNSAHEASLGRTNRATRPSRAVPLVFIHVAVIIADIDIHRGTAVASGRDRNPPVPVRGCPNRVDLPHSPSGSSPTAQEPKAKKNKPQTAHHGQRMLQLN
jgi:hypothetical protein